MEKTITAKLGHFRQSPRKVRLVANLLRGKQVNRALVDLSLLPKKAAEPFTKLIKSAVANAISQQLQTDNLFIKKVAVDGGAILYRRRFRARGRVVPIRKRTSKIVVELGEKNKDNANPRINANGTNKKIKNNKS